MDPLFTATMALSRDLCKQGCYLQAAKCLQAACNHSQVLPTSRAVAFLDFASILMVHFDNLDLAKKLILQAERELRTARGHQGLKCEVFQHLIKCHRDKGDLQQALDACRAGLAVCNEGEGDLVRWKVYFMFQLAECHMDIANDTDAALETLKQVASVQGVIEEDLALAALSCAAISLHSGRLDSADQYLTACASMLEGLVDEAGARCADLNRVRVQYFLVYATTAQAVGRSAQLQQGNEYPIFTQMQESLNNVPVTTRGWLPSPAAAALGHLLHASVLRSAGKGSAAVVQLGQAEELVDQAIALANVDWNAGEGDIAGTTLAGVRVYLRLKASIIEQRAVAALLSTDLMVTAKYGAELMSALQRYPRTLRCQAASACMLLGHYAHTVRQYDLAIASFSSVLKVEAAAHLQKLAAIATSLSELQRGGDGDVQRARSWLEGQGISDVAALSGLGTHERATAQLLHGLLLLRDGDPTGARLLLTKALKQAHGRIGSTQLVGQILNVLAPVQRARQDVTGAKQMFESATTLLKSIGDLPSLVTTLSGLYSLHEHDGDDLAGKSQRYMQRKADDWQARLEAIRGCNHHIQLLQASGWLHKFATGQ